MTFQDRSAELDALETAFESPGRAFHGWFWTSAPTSPRRGDRFTPTKSWSSL